MLKKRLFIVALIACVPTLAAPSRAADRLWLNGLSVDVPFDGGVLVSGSRLWRLTRNFSAGFVAGGGAIDRDFEITGSDGVRRDASSEALILPFAGPTIALYSTFVSISLSYAFYYARTDLVIDGGPTETTSGIGGSLYSPVLALEVYNRDRGLTAGVGFGGFLGTFYPELEAGGNGVAYRTSEDPLEGFTVHARIAWVGNLFRRPPPEPPFK